MLSFSSANDSVGGQKEQNYQHSRMAELSKSEEDVEADGETSAKPLRSPISIRFPVFGLYVSPKVWSLLANLLPIAANNNGFPTF